MRSILTTGGIPTFVSSHEWEFLEEVFADKNMIFKRDLNERQSELARILTKRGILNRSVDKKNGVCYSKNQNSGIL